MDPTREISCPLVLFFSFFFFLRGTLICETSPVRGGAARQGGLYLARVRRRAKERGSIFHCVIPLPSSSPRLEKRRISERDGGRRGASRRRDRREIPALAQESLFSPFVQRTYGAPEARGDPASLRPREPMRHGAAGGLAFRRPRPRLTKPGLNLSRAFVDPLARRPPRSSTIRLLRRRACLNVSATRTAAEGFSFDINTRRYRGRVGVSVYVHASVIGTNVAVNSPK